MTGLWLISYIGLWALVILEAVVILALARQIGLLQIRLGATGARMGNAGLELGDRAPSFSEKDLNGKVITLGTQPNKPTLLIFISPTCSVCAELGPAIRSLYRHEKKHVEIIVISLLKDEAANRAYIHRHHLSDIPFILSPDLAEKYQVATSPYGILVNVEGKIHTKGLANNIEHLESLLNTLEEGYPSYDSKMNALMAVQGNSHLNRGEE